MADQTCSECLGKPYARGLCRLHYHRWYNAWRKENPGASSLRRRRSAEVLEEYDFLSEAGESLDLIAEALGIQTESLQRALWRAGRGWIPRSRVS